MINHVFKLSKFKRLMVGSFTVSKGVRPGGRVTPVLDGVCRSTGCPLTVKIMRQGVLC